MWGESWGDSNATPMQMGPGRFVGNSRQLDITPSFQTYRDVDRTGLGGASCVADELDALNLTMSLSCFSGMNLRAALFGDSCTTGAAQSISCEVLPLQGACLPCDSVLMFSQPLVDQYAPMAVTVMTETQSNTLVEGEDYERTAFGIRLLRPITGEAGSYINVSYTSIGSTESVEAFTRSSTEVGLIFEGVNKVDNSPIVAQIYRLRLSAAESFSLITEGLGELRLSGELLPIRAPKNKSRYFRVLRAPAEDPCGGDC